jgi:hypothetical protein
MLEGNYVVLQMIRELEDELAGIRRTRLTRAAASGMLHPTPGRSRSIGFEATLLGRRLIARLSLQPVNSAGGPIPPASGMGAPPGGWTGGWRTLRGI